MDKGRGRHCEDIKIVKEMSKYTSFEFDTVPTPIVFPKPSVPFKFSKLGTWGDETGDPHVINLSTYLRIKRERESDINKSKVQNTDENSWTSDDEDDSEYKPHDFHLPQINYDPTSWEGRWPLVPEYFPKIRSVFEVISQDEEILCTIDSRAVCNPSEVYLIRPQGRDSVVAHLDEFYNFISTSANRCQWIPRLAHIKPGLLVAVYKISKNKWYRARIVMRYKYNGQIEAEMIDTGEKVIISPEVFYLDTRFLAEPELAVKCRLAVSKYLDDFHTGEMNWPPDVAPSMKEVLAERPFYVRFHAPVLHRGEEVWEVTPERYPDELMIQFPLNRIMNGVSERFRFPPYGSLEQYFNLKKIREQASLRWKMMMKRKDAQELDGWKSEKFCFGCLEDDDDNTLELDFDEEDEY